MRTACDLMKRISVLARNTLHNLKRNGILFTLRYFPYHLKLTLLETKDLFDSQHGTDTSQIVSVHELNPVTANNFTHSSAYVPTNTLVFKEMMNSSKMNYYSKIYYFSYYNFYSFSSNMNYYC